MRCVTVDFATADFSEIDDGTTVCNLRRGATPIGTDLAANGESVGLLMARCRSAGVPALLVDRGKLLQPAGAHPLAGDRSAR